MLPWVCLWGGVPGRVMIFQLAVVGRRRGARSAGGDLVAEYLKRAGRYHTVELRQFGAEQDLVAALTERGGRSAPSLIALDSRGEQISSEELAGVLGVAMDGGVQRMVIAVGPADGWSAGTLKLARRVLAFGRITLPHELAAVVAAEQIYRAFTIRAGHPYHCGH